MSDQSKPGEQHADGLVQELDLEQQLADDVVRTAQRLVRVRERVDGREETAIEPAPALQDKVGHFGRHVGLARRALDVLQHPRAPPLEDQFET